MDFRHRLRETSARVPWWLKLACKLVLSRLPVAHRHWKRLGLFEHGRMEQPQYARQVWARHQRARVHSLGGSQRALLELGPGEGGCTFGLALAAGYEDIVLVDVQPFFERERFLTVQALRACGASLEPDLARSRVRYLTRGLASLGQLRDRSMDLVFSHTVLQHVRLAEFDRTLAQLFRITRPGGVGSHRIDFRDMLGGSVNNLRIPSRLWEQDWFAGAGFYTNRLRLSQVLGRFRGAGFELVDIAIERFQTVPEAASRRCREFAGVTPEDLMIRACDLVVRRPA